MTYDLKLYLRQFYMQELMNDGLFRVVKLILNLFLFNTLYVSLSIEKEYILCVKQKKIQYQFFQYLFPLMRHS